jgi:hypothetical protein
MSLVQLRIANPAHTTDSACWFAAASTQAPITTSTGMHQQGAAPADIPT